MYLMSERYTQTFRYWLCGPLELMVERTTYDNETEYLVPPQVDTWKRRIAGFHPLGEIDLAHDQSVRCQFSVVRAPTNNAQHWSHGHEGKAFWGLLTRHHSEPTNILIADAKAHPDAGWIYANDGTINAVIMVPSPW